ncbi:MAG: TolC family protein, partial [Kangiellaceae bacterium]|nr:TolC family protein [Kangiellaceae bacterium]
MKSRSSSLFVRLVSGLIILQSTSAFAEAQLSLQKAIHLAQSNDPWLVQSKQTENSILAKSVSESALPDPKLSLSLANLPTDGLDFSQEAMTQFKVGYSQMIPAGDSLELKSERLRQSAAQFPILRQARLAELEKEVAHTWFELFRANKSIDLIKQNQTLFEQLVDVAQASYSSAAGKTSQQDIVRAQLELTLLQERLSKLTQQQEIMKERLLGWISDNYVSNYQMDDYSDENSFKSQVLLPLKMPNGQLIEMSGSSVEEFTTSQVTQALMQHPDIVVRDQKVKVHKTSIALAEQSYKPSWGISASYAYRDDDPMGTNRSDFLSVGVSFELPIFADTKQDQLVKAAKLETEASKTQKWQVMRKMLSGFQIAVARYKRLIEREGRYKSSLLPKMQEQAEAALNAYTNDEGDF